MADELVALRGRLFGSDRAALIKQARDKTSTYFGVECVSVKLSGETPHPTGGFNAEFTGVIWHDIEPKAFGPDRCRQCKRDSWPQSPLNLASRKAWS